jgi:hypothetical protein
MASAACWSTATFYVFAFATLGAMILVSLINIWSLLSTFRRAQREKRHAAAAGGRRADFADGPIRPRRSETLPMGGAASVELGAVGSPQNPARTVPNPLHAGAQRSWGTDSVAEHHAAVLDEGMRPDRFAELWGALPETGGFDTVVEVAPDVEQLRAHLEGRGFQVMASGIVNEVLKLYFSGEENGATSRGATSRFLAELVLTTTTMLLSVKFKCEDPSATKGFVQRLQLRKLFFRGGQ